MAVYVGTIPRKYGRMIMFHMVADTLDELYEMVDKIGVNRKYFQQKRQHFDICKSKKAKAIKFGAIELNDRHIVNMKQKPTNT